MIPNADHMFQDEVEILRKQIERLAIPKSPILSIDIIDKHFMGRPVKVLKVTTLLPEYVREYRKDREITWH